MAEDAVVAAFFLALSECGVTPALDERSELRELLPTVLETATRAWPTFAMPATRFAQHLARHAANTDAANAYLRSVHSADLYLALAAADGDAPAMRAFEHDYIARVGEYVVRTTVARDVVDEVKQRLRTTFFLAEPGEDDPSARPGKLLEYSGKGPLGGWIRVSAVRTALNCLRAAGDVRSADKETNGVALDPELSFAHAAADNVFREAFREALAKLDAEARSILRLHYMQGLTMDQLAGMFHTSRSSIARRVAAVRTEILERTEQYLREERGLSATEVASLVRRADSQLNVTITKLLDP